MLEQIEVNNKLLHEGWITKEQHARLIIRDGRVWDNVDSAFDLTEQGDVKLRGSLVWLRGYAKYPEEVKGDETHQATTQDRVQAPDDGEKDGAETKEERKCQLKITTQQSS